MDYLEKLKELVAKIVTVAGTVFVSNNGFDALITFMGGGSELPMKTLSVIAAYAVWTQVIVPFVDTSFKETTKTAASPGQSSWGTKSKLV